jgi:CHAT domain-containing protein
VRVARGLAGEKEIAEEVGKFRLQIDTLRYGATTLKRHRAVLVRRVHEHLQSLYALVLEPLEPLIGSRNLIIAPHRSLHYLPFQALHDGSSYLIETREVSYTPSAQLLQQCIEQPRRQVNQAVVFGNLDELIPRVTDEIKAIQAIFPNAISRLNAEATAAELQTRSPQADVLHLACHAHFRADNPLFSSLELADGRFTVRDAYRLKLNCELVTLSACETGVNAVMPGEELIGLARGFFSAGTPTVLLSLWTVDDEATVLLMSKFYREFRADGSAARALRAAQIEALKQNPHPFYWAPFVLVGRG